MRLSFYITGIVALIFIGCKSDSNPVQSAAQNAYLRLVNLNYDQPSLNLDLNDQRLIGGVEPFTSSGFTKTSSGSYLLKIAYSNSNSTIFARNSTLEANNFYSLFFFVRNNLIHSFWMVEELNIDENVARVRFLHSSVQGDTVDFQLKNSTDSTLFSEITYGEFAETETLPQGSYSARIMPYNSGAYSVYNSDIALEGGHTYTLFISNESPQAWSPYILHMIDDTSENQLILDID